MDLSGTVVLVTGASTGIGEAACHVLARRGARVLLVARSADTLESVAPRSARRAGGHRRSRPTSATSLPWPSCRRGCRPKPAFPT